MSIGPRNMRRPTPSNRSGLQLAMFLVLLSDCLRRTISGIDGYSCKSKLSLLALSTRKARVLLFIVISAALSNERVSRYNTTR